MDLVLPGRNGRYPLARAACVSWGLLLVTVLGPVAGASAAERHLTPAQVHQMMNDARQKGLTRMARKTKAVDARPARPGEVIVTVIAGEGQETRSAAAKIGDWVVRNLCPETGHEQYLVSAAKFAERYAATARPPGSDGWQEFRPLAKPMRFLTVGSEQGSFTFEAPWGEAMVAGPGDAIVQNPQDEKDTYRVARLSFACTYEIVE